MAAVVTDPLVCCVMLTRDRPAMTAKAVECWRAQTYPSKLIVMDSSAKPINIVDKHVSILSNSNSNLTIGALRNGAAEYATKYLFAGPPDLIAHWDDDDYSHPLRLEHQVAALMARSDADCVGYRSALFWDERNPTLSKADYRLVGLDGEAWRYRCLTPQFVVGASMLYRRSAWERRPFENIHRGEDTRWQMGVKVLPLEGAGDADKLEEPMMICRIHAGSTSTGTPGRGPDWVRVREYDSYCRERMKL